MTAECPRVESGRSPVSRYRPKADIAGIW